MMNQTGLVFVTAVAAAVALSACSSSDSGSADTKTYQSNDAAADTINDSPDASASDATVDTAPGIDATMDTTPEIDAAPEADAAAEVGVDSAPDPNDIDDDNDGFSENQGDCADDDDQRFPGATEICDNGIDDDCDTVVDDVGGATETLGPSPYLQASDSPWSNDPTLTTFVIVDFEDKTLPDGVSASNFSWSSSFGLSLVDSVDGDDGDPTDGVCNPCEAMWAGGPITFTFDEAVLGRLPTHVGIVVTDSGAANVNVTLSATSTCASLGALESSITFGDGSVGGETAEDRFVGFVSPAGITTFTISIGTALEVDHLQFGW